MARYRTLGYSFVAVDGELKPRRRAAAEPELLTIFGFDVVAGDLRDALVGRNAIITASAAQALFGTFRQDNHGPRTEQRGCHARGGDSGCARAKTRARGRSSSCCS